MPFTDKNEWKPTKKQARFLSIPFSIKEAMLGGGAGLGKSELLLMFQIVHELYKNPAFKQLFLRRTHKQLKKEIVPRSYLIYPKFGATFNESDMVWTFPREDQYGSGAKPAGAKIFLGHCENENDVHIYDSMEINLFTPDEITSLTEYIYVYIGFTRVRTSDPTLPAIIRGAGMPGDVGHTFVKKRFVDPCKFGDKVIIGRGGNKRIYIHATLADNPHIDQAYRQSLEMLPEAEKQAKLYGSWEAYLGQVFEEFRDKHYPDEPDNAIHVIDPFTIPAFWPKIVAIDWGFNAMCSIGFAAISPNKKIYVYRHLMYYGQKIHEWAGEVKYWIDNDNPAEVIICHSANQHRGDPHTILEQVSDALGVSIKLGEKNRIAGKTLLHEYLRWKPRPKISKTESGSFDNELAQWILRNKGLDDYNIYCRSFNTLEEAEDIPRLLFFDQPDVKVICDSIKSCVYEKETKDGKKKEDVAEFNGDDPYDMLRLLLHSADGFFQMATDKNIELVKRQQVIDMLSHGGDQTQFYMNMRRIESEAGLDARPVNMHHRGKRMYNA